MTDPNKTRPPHALLNTATEPLVPWTTVHTAAVNANMSEISLLLGKVLDRIQDGHGEQDQWEAIRTCSESYAALARTVNGFYGRDGTPPRLCCDTVEPNSPVTEWGWDPPAAIPESDPAGREMREVFLAAGEAALARALLPANRKKGDRAGAVRVGVHEMARRSMAAMDVLRARLAAGQATWADVEAQAADCLALLSFVWDQARTERLRAQDAELSKRVQSTLNHLATREATKQAVAQAERNELRAERDRLRDALKNGNDAWDRLVAERDALRREMESLKSEMARILVPKGEG